MVYLACADERAAERGSKGEAGERGDIMLEREPVLEWLPWYCVLVWMDGMEPLRRWEGRAIWDGYESGMRGWRGIAELESRDV